jgi:hypothetical protein
MKPISLEEITNQIRLPLEQSKLSRELENELRSGFRYSPKRNNNNNNSYSAKIF